MKIALVLVLMLFTLSAAEDFNRHSISATVIPFDPGIIYPDIGYEYSFTENDAIGISSGVGLVNRLIYTRKIGVLALTGSLGFISTEHDFSRTEVFTAISAEYRQPLGEHVYSRIVASGVFFDDLPYDLPLIPVLQIGFGYGF